MHTEPRKTGTDKRDMKVRICGEQDWEILPECGGKGKKKIMWENIIDIENRT